MTTDAKYIPLTLKYRPQVLDDVEGQDNIVEMLTNAARTKRISNVYLFCGPAGTGKTSIARIWSKMLNCKSDNPPCCECSTCKSIANGTNLDVLELNAAEKRKIDDIRDVLGRIRFKPMSKYKIVILDEVHMLTSEAFNALLKDLEEPPEYCIFILCTTNPEKIPTTILSRCIEFDFHSVMLDNVVARLEYICDEEGFTYEEEALHLIAKKSNGGMRDALSSLEQVAIFSNNDITVKCVTQNLDIIDEDTFSDLITSLHQHDIISAIQQVDNLIAQNKTLSVIYTQLLDAYGDLLKNQFKHSDSSAIRYTKMELLAICKLFVDYESKMKFASDQYYVLTSLLYDITNSSSSDINERLGHLEDIILSGNFKANNVDTDRINRIKLALGGKQDKARALKEQQEEPISQPDSQPPTKDEEPDEFLSSFLNLSKATLEE